MILFEYENSIFNVSNANIVDVLENEINIYYNNDNVIQINNYETEIDTSLFGDYFFKFETEERKIYFNKFNFLYIQKLEQEIVRFQFFEKFTFDLMVDYEQLISQLENT